MPTTLIPTSFQLPALALLILGGVIAWAAGYRLFRFVLTLFGFYIGALAATAVLGPGDRTLLIFAALGGGAVGALIMFFGYFVGVALVGAGIGALSVHMIWSRLGSDPHAFVVILAAVAGAADGDGAAALRHHHRDGVFRRMDDAVGRDASDGLERQPRAEARRVDGVSIRSLAGRPVDSRSVGGNRAARRVRSASLHRPVAVAGQAKAKTGDGLRA